MRVIRSAAQMARWARRLEARRARVGLVPTMGALHEGHLSLIRRAASQNDAVIVTIFVNPLQFGPGEAFTRYPRDLRRDLRLARAAGADAVFAPAAGEVYPPRFQTAVEVGPLAARWEGRARPGHFQGVATVVARLFELTRPATAYFGQKDYQQTLVIRHLIRDLRLPVRLRVLPTVREPGGLAMSSRNGALSVAQRRRAVALYRALCAGRDRIHSGERRGGRVAALMRGLIRAQAGVRLDYAAAVDGRTLEPLRTLRGRVALLGAVRVGRTRLIDNLLVDVP